MPLNRLPCLRELLGDHPPLGPEQFATPQGEFHPREQRLVPGRSNASLREPPEIGPVVVTRAANVPGTTRLAFSTSTTVSRKVL